VTVRAGRFKTARLKRTNTSSELSNEKLQHLSGDAGGFRTHSAPGGRSYFDPVASRRFGAVERLIGCLHDLFRRTILP
jgi:hypothetical protein